MSRPCGTWCFLEREVFLRETPAHLTWAYKEYAAGTECIKAFRIIVAPGRSGAFVLGKVQPLNYAEQMQRVKQNALHVQTVKMTFEDKTVFTVPFYRVPQPVPQSVRHTRQGREHLLCTGERGGAVLRPPGRAGHFRREKTGPPSPETADPVDHLRTAPLAALL